MGIICLSNNSGSNSDGLVNGKGSDIICAGAQAGCARPMLGLVRVCAWIGEALLVSGAGLLLGLADKRPSF